MSTLTGTPLEVEGQKILASMDFVCLHDLGQALKIEVHPGGAYSSGEHVEFDYLIPNGQTCVVGEMKGTLNASTLKNEYKKFRVSFNWLKDRVEKGDLSEANWKALGVPDSHVHYFRDVRVVRGFIVAPYLQKLDCNLSPVPGIARFYKSDWDLIVEYARSIGPYARDHLLYRLNVSTTAPLDDLVVGRGSNYVVQSPHKKIASGAVGLADLFTFQVSPYRLLPIAQVYRRDELPNLSSTPSMDFQRPLVHKKLSSIRSKLLTDDFMFPNSILVVLSHDSEFRETGSKERQGTLHIPNRFGAVSVIDGQHRLFAYADKQVEERLKESGMIMVTAIKFKSAVDKEIRKFSAQAFVEINTNQTAVPRALLDAIAYDVLGETHPRAIAANVMLQANERRGPLHGLFDTNQTRLGVIKATTVLTSLQRLTNLKTLNALRAAKKKERILEKQGYEYLYGVDDIEKICQPGQLIKKSTDCLNTYFIKGKQVFPHDWPERGKTKKSSLELAKMMAAFVRLLGTFVSEGLTWDEVETELEKIRNNVLTLRKDLASYNAVLFQPTHLDIPDSQPTEIDDYHFLNRNRAAPTSIQDI